MTEKAFKGLIRPLRALIRFWEQHEMIHWHIFTQTITHHTNLEFSEFGVSENPCLPRELKESQEGSQDDFQEPQGQFLVCFQARGASGEGQVHTPTSPHLPLPPQKHSKPMENLPKTIPKGPLAREVS